ncbi:unnamed protein product [Rotaria sp. Silwood2]|nr:unnamed protein product [Rotaria sp. Silwood2]CAF4373209.1 unnamed protein product [Rotaria sp. Silwood2]
MESVTKIPEQLIVSTVEGHRLSIFDTPAFQSDDFENTRCLNRLLLTCHKFNVIIFVQNIINYRVNPTLMEEIKVYKYDFDLPIILVRNQASPKTKHKLKTTWIKHDDIETLVCRMNMYITRRPSPDLDKETRLGQLNERVLRVEALKRSKYALIPVGTAAVAAVTIGLCPVPFADAFLLIPTQLGMFAGICAAFKLKFKKGMLIWLVATGLGSFGLDFRVARVIVNIVKTIPGANIPAMAIDGSIAFVCTLALGLGFIAVAVLRHLHIKGIDLYRMNDDARKKILKDLIQEEVKKKCKSLYGKNNDKNVLLEEQRQFDDIPMAITNSEAFDIEQLMKRKEEVLKQEKLQKAEKLCKLQELNHENKTIKDVCRICLRCTPNIIIQPCGHCCICEIYYIDHKTKTKFCPECGEKIISFSKYTKEKLAVALKDARHPPSAHAIIESLRIPFPKNGVPSTTMEDKLISVKNTCSLDSSLFLLYYAYTTSCEEFRMLFQRDSRSVYSHLRKTFSLVDSDG